jgi:exodeoxyribonuclease V alpha subunit
MKIIPASETIQNILQRLNRSRFRSQFILGPKDVAYLHEKGLDAIRRHAVDCITTRISPAHPENDGRQTPWKGHPVFVAQHGTGTCCRRCIHRWHGIPLNRVLTHEEVEFMADLIMAWITHRLKTVWPIRM